MRIVLDTNVLVSGLIVARNAPGRIIDLIRTARLDLVVDDRILAEYEAVLSRDYFRTYFTLEEKARVMAYIRMDAQNCICAEAIAGLPDPYDAPFAEAALTAGVPLVTGNAKHFPSALCRGIQIFSPSAFLEHFQKA